MDSCLDLCMSTFTCAIGATRVVRGLLQIISSYRAVIFQVATLFEVLIVPSEQNWPRHWLGHVAAHGLVEGAKLQPPLPNVVFPPVCWVHVHEFMPRLDVGFQRWGAPVARFQLFPPILPCLDRELVLKFVTINPFQLLGLCSNPWVEPHVVLWILAVDHARDTPVHVFEIGPCQCREVLPVVTVVHVVSQLVELVLEIHIRCRSFIESALHRG
mmetsp:Transcript_82969/g.143796  ORF Transcript_82969/g.143796 Transcript_82969/m.143796 type:complete len:214 (+) Transcript_82969:45-686(+)